MQKVKCIIPTLHYAKEAVLSFFWLRCNVAVASFWKTLQASTYLWGDVFAKFVNYA